MLFYRKILEPREQVTYHYEKWRPTYNNETSPYVNWCENSTVDCLTLENATMGEALAEIAPRPRGVRRDASSRRAHPVDEE